MGSELGIESAAVSHHLPAYLGCKDFSDAGDLLNEYIQKRKAARAAKSSVASALGIARARPLADIDASNPD
jgi:hypothetical protein